MLRQVGIMGEVITIDDDNYNWFWPQYEAGVWEPHTLATLKKVLTPDKVYVDIGAWIGPTVLYAANFCKRSIAIEPDPVAFPVLVHNTWLNSKDVECRQLMISDSDGMGCLKTYSSFGDSMSVISSAPQHEGVCHEYPIETMRLETLLTEIGLDDIGLVKIDIEGGEVIVLKDSLDFIRRTLPNIYLSLHPCWFGHGADFEESANVIMAIADAYGGDHAQWLSGKLYEGASGIDMLLIKG